MLHRGILGPPLGAALCESLAALRSGLFSAQNLLGEGPLHRRKGDLNVRNISTGNFITATRLAFGRLGIRDFDAYSRPSSLYGRAEKRPLRRAAKFREEPPRKGEPKFHTLQMRNASAKYQYSA
jgi:hypothetical protein